MERKWSIRAYKKGDENGIYELEKKIDSMYPGRDYTFNDWKKWWDWKYKENPANKNEPKIWISEYDGEIVGCDAFIPIKMKIKNKIYNIVQNVDLMVHPNFRRQGMFLSLANKSFSSLKQNNQAIAYGFPNRYAYGGHMKYGWFDVSLLKNGIKPIKTDKFIEKHLSNNNKKNQSFSKKIYINLVKKVIKTIFKEKKTKKTDNISISQVFSFDEDIDSFWKKISDNYNIIVVRDKKYLNWRYVNVPDKKYIIYIAKENNEICGYIIFRCEIQKENRKYGSIYDIIALKNRPDIIYSLLDKTIEYFNKENIDFIHCSMLADNKIIKLFKNKGFIFSQVFLRQKKDDRKFIAYLDHSDIEKKYLKNSNNWFIQYGDSDEI